MAKRNKRRHLEPVTQFWDASVFVALLAKQDSRHRDALKIHEGLKERKVRLYTSWPTISEAATVLLYHAGYTPAISLSKIMQAFTVLKPSESDYTEAFALFKEFNRDQKFSMNDVLTYVIVRDRLAEASLVTFDKDFSKMGLTIFKL